MENPKVQQLQFLEQNLQSVLMQKQAFQMELGEISSSMEEIEKSDDDVYKVIGQLMIKVSRDKTLEELKSKDKVFSKRLEDLNKQEKNISEDIKKIREEIMSSLKKE